MKLKYPQRPNYLNSVTLDASMMDRMKMAQGASVLSLWRVSFRNTARVKALQTETESNT